MFRNKSFLILLIAGWVLLPSCNDADQSREELSAVDQNNTTYLFTLLTAESTGIHFINNIEEDENRNIYSHEYMYNGGGVAVGDLNNDGLADIYFTGNMVPNKLYLNKGNMVFEDVTAIAEIAVEGSWCSGVSFIDINTDGLLDIYVCRAFYHDENLRHNLLFINQGDMKFVESGASYGVDDPGYSTQATWLDYDKDGDIDLFVGNYPSKLIKNLERAIYMRDNPDNKESDHLYRNNGDGTFTNVTSQAGLLNYGFALGIVSGDLNNDGWTDIYVANDYEEADHLYMNNGNGTFTNVIGQAVKHLSNFGMGVDLADFNNDGYLDIAVMDMLAEDNYRQKTQMPAMSPERFWLLVDQGYHYQYMRNSLQLNNRNGTFSEIAQLSGVATTDWSWAVLMADFDNDGLKDMFTTNGYRRDSRDKDFNHELEMKVTGDGANIDFEDYISSMPTTRLHNFLFRNEGNMIFSDQSYAFGIDQPGYSNGATYADLDNDGDLDLVVNNLVDKAFIYRNNSNENEGSNYLRIKFNGSKNNPQGIGTKVEISIGENHQYQELTLTRGYQSGVEPILHFGVGASNVIERVLVTWPDGKEEELIDVKANQVLELKYSDASIVGVSLEKNDPIFIELPRSVTDFIHVENEFDDYFGESLLPHKMSQFGPNISIGDIDKDGNEDFYIGGAALQSGALFRTNSEGAFIRLTNQPWENEIDYEDLGSVFFDADNDGDEDLYIVSGGNEYAPGSIYLQDRLYLNDGDGQFTKAVDRLPNITSSGSCVIAGDYDKDGDMDLFVGGRVLPGKYPFAPRSYILQNNNGVFKDVTKDIAPGLFEPGMVTSAVWTDIDKDNDLDLIIVGEWMPVSIYENEDGTFTDATSKYGLSHTVGWWNKIIAADFDHDGDMEYVLGNLGLNSKFKASQTEPLHVYCSDFDNSGTLDIVLGYYNQGVCFPVRGRQCTSEQMPVIRDQFPTYDQFAKASLVEVYGSRLDEAEHHEAKVFTTSYLENNNGTLTLTALPIEAQFSPVFGIVAEDFDHDGNRDILLSGNFYAPEVETGRYDASIGLLLTGSGTGKFIPVNVNESGFFTPGDVKDMTLLHNGFGGEVFILVANNNDRLQVFKTRLSIPVFGD